MLWRRANRALAHYNVESADAGTFVLEPIQLELLIFNFQFSTQNHFVLKGLESQVETLNVKLSN